MSIKRLGPSTLKPPSPSTPALSPVAPKPVPTPVPSGFTGFRAGKVALRPAAPMPPKTAPEATRRARALLEGPVKADVQKDGSIVIEDAASVNDARDLAGPRAEAAARQVAENAVLEGQALDALSPRDRARYLLLKKTLQTTSDGKPMGDPVAALSLQTMLLEGKLPGGKLLENLTMMAKQPLAEGIDRHQLISDVVQELAVPEAIAQRNRGTCVPTSIEIQLVQQDPAEYARLVSGLATPEGTVTTRGGDVLTREAGVLADDTNRSASQRLLAPALMELGNGRADYDNADDKHHDGDETSGGLTAAQADVVLESLYDHDFAFMNTGGEKEKAAGTDFVMHELSSGRSVLVGLQWGEGGHKVLVTGTEHRDGVDYVKIINPWGREELLPKADFEARLRNVNYDPAAPIRDFFDWLL